MFGVKLYHPCTGDKSSYCTYHRLLEPLYRHIYANTCNIQFPGPHPTQLSMASSTGMLGGGLGTRLITSTYVAHFSMDSVLARH